MTSTGPIEPVTIEVTPTVQRYLEALVEYGLLEGDEEQRISATGEKLLRALHHHLGGGEVSVEILANGSSAAVEHLDGMLDQMQRECPDVRLQSGVYCY